MRAHLKSRIGKLLAQVESLPILKPLNKLDLRYAKISTDERRRLYSYTDAIDRMVTEGAHLSNGPAIPDRDAPDFMDLLSKVYTPMFPGDTLDKYVARYNAANAITKLHESSSVLPPAPPPTKPMQKNARERSVLHERSGIDNDRAKPPKNGCVG